MMSLHSVQHLFMPFYNAPYLYALQVYNTIWPPCKLDILWPWVMASRFHCYSCDTASDSHMIMCEFHQLLLSWTNLGLMATHYNHFSSPCWVQCVSVVTSLSDLLLYSLIVVLSTEAKVLKWLVSTMTTDSVFLFKKHVSTLNLTEEVFPNYMSKNCLSH